VTVVATDGAFPMVFAALSDDNASMSQPPPKIPDYHGPPSRGTPPAPVLTPEQTRAIELGRQRAQKIRRAATVSKIDGGIMAFFAAGALASICLGWEGFILGIALTIVSVNSFRGAARLTRMDLTAPAFLAINQFFLAASIIIYALYCLHAGLTSKPDEVQQLLRQLSSDPQTNDELNRLYYWVLYGLLIIGTVVAQGLAALYYGSRAKYLKAYLRDTPQWVVDLQKAQLG
jgi:hypothetical protein